MSFTSLSLVKKHLLTTVGSPMSFTNQPVTLTGTDAVDLPHCNLVDNSVAVKSQHALAPDQDGPITLTNYDWGKLASGQIVPDSVVVAIDPLLNIVYLEEVDYKIDYDAGKIRRVQGGAIANAQVVYCFYYKYTLFTCDTDYHVDYLHGSLSRTAGGGIPDGATVLVDYAVGAGELLDILIEQAIVEAEDLIVRSLSSDYSSSSTEVGLRTGATELALSIITRDTASETLKQWRGTDGYQRSKEWRELSALYERRAYQTLSPYLLPNYMRSSMARSSEG